jgi:DNA-binding transcriptional regulator LsrR (DeoR family)
LTKITKQQLLQKMDEVGVKYDDEARTTKELQKEWNCSHYKILQLLHEARELGLLEVTKKRIETLSGVIREAPAFIIHLDKLKRRGHK